MVNDRKWWIKLEICYPNNPMAFLLYIVVILWFQNMDNAKKYDAAIYLLDEIME